MTFWYLLKKEIFVYKAKLWRQQICIFIFLCAYKKFKFFKFVNLFSIAYTLLTKVQLSFKATAVA